MNPSHAFMDASHIKKFRRQRTYGTFLGKTALTTVSEDDIWFRSPEPLGAPLGMMGFIVGLFATDFWATIRFVSYTVCYASWGSLFRTLRLDWDERLMIALLYACTFGLAGRWVARKLMAGAPPKRTMVVAIYAAAQAAACGIGMVTFGQGFAIGVLLGIVCATICAPFAMLLAHNASWAWLARTDSILHATYRRARWVDVATGVTVLLSLYANPVFGVGGHVRNNGRGIVATLLVLVAASMAVVVAVSAVSSIMRISRLGARFRSASGTYDIDSEGDAPVVDVGFGDERKHDVATASSAYRHQDRIEAVCVGDLKRAWRVIGFAMGRSIAVVALGAVILGTHFRVPFPFHYGYC
jgi:hypothetical protein